LHRCYW